MHKIYSGLNSQFEASFSMVTPAQMYILKVVRTKIKITRNRSSRKSTKKGNGQMSKLIRCIPLEK